MAPVKNSAASPVNSTPKNTASERRKPGGNSAMFETNLFAKLTPQDGMINY